MSTSFNNSVTIRLPDDLLQEVADAAKQERSKTSEIIRRALSEHFERRKAAAKRAQKGAAK